VNVDLHRSALLLIICISKLHAYATYLYVFRKNFNQRRAKFGVC